ncbi:hypothetical protein F5X99DRAFT_380559 [Biscogniauxia marginata]|nr:hypothetical protein F5X99DRAFT_380559 [Biscogniauxia marginata]
MDGVSSVLELVGSVISVVNLSIALVTYTKHIYHKGYIDGNINLVTVANIVQNVTKGLEEQLDRFIQEDRKPVLDEDVEREICLMRFERITYILRIHLRN